MEHRMFDTWKYVKLLKRHHFSEEQAIGLMEAQMLMAHALFSRGPTREDLSNSEFAMRAPSESFLPILP